MALDQSLVKKTESTIDDLVDLWRRRRLLCIIVIIVIIAPTLMSVIIIPYLNQRLEKVEDERDDAKDERDKAEIQLAPFLAAANQRFPNTAPDKRLELLLARLDQAIISVQDAARRVSPERSLAPEVQSSLVTKLRVIPALNVDVTCVLGDTEGFALASQIKNLFEEAEWEVSGVNQSVYRVPIKHLVLTFGKEPSLELQRALFILFDSLGYPREATINEEIGENALEIIVGSK